MAQPAEQGSDESSQEQELADTMSVARYNPGLEEIADRAADRLAELTQEYCGEGRMCSGPCKQFKAWEDFSKDLDKNGHRSCKNGRRSQCKACCNKYTRDRRRGVKRPAPERPDVQPCRQCKRDLPLDSQNFYKDTHTTWGYSRICRPCKNEYSKVLNNLRMEHPKAEAGGRCFACNRETDDLVLDHCHSTNAFRGWACRGCNRRLSAPYSQS